MLIKLIKVRSNHENLRTNAVIASLAHIPRLGESIVLLAESLTIEGAVRVIKTTPVKVLVLETPDRYRITTENSEYLLEILNWEVGGTAEKLN